MAKFFKALEAAHRKLIETSPIFFVATAAPDGRVNLSPKGRDSVRVDGPGRISWRNLTGSGNETAGHLQALNRITLMWCSFTLKPVILRVYGTAAMITPADAEWAVENGRFPHDPGARQICRVAVDEVQTSCGFAVPFMDFKAERDTLYQYWDQRGPEGVRAYWGEKNRTTIDGLPTGIEAQV
jgi:hypothetical protein